MDDSRTVWCGNLSDKVTEELLYELFLQAAPLERVKIPTDKEGRKSNFAFITMKHEVSVPYATQLLNGTSLFDKKITVKPRHNPQNQAMYCNDKANAFKLTNSPSNYHNHQNYREDLEPYRREDFRHGYDNRQNEYNSNRNNEYNSNRQNDYNSNRQNDYGSNRHRRNNNHRNFHERNNSRNRY